MDEREILHGDSIGQEYSVPCIRCDNSTKHEVVTSVDIKEDFDDGNITEWTSYQILRCRGCESHSFRSSKASTEDLFETVFGEPYQWVEAKVYPPRVAGRRKVRNLHHLPPKVKRIYNETHTALSSDLPMLAGVGIRSLVEAICQEREAQGNNLKAKIDDLVKQGLLTQSGAEILQKLRLMGNEAVHEMKRHDTRSLGIAFDVVEHLLLGVYILPEEAERIK